MLVPNQRGLELAAGADEIAVFVSATEPSPGRTWAPLGRGIEMAAPAITEARSRGLTVRGYVSMCFGDPWEGRVDPRQPAAVARRLVDLGCTEISLGDTIGVATAGQVAAVLDAVEQAGIERDRLALHFHDTYGQALANVLAGLEAGSRHSTPRPAGSAAARSPSATGNLATEDLSGCSRASASPTASTWRRWSRPADGWPACSVAPRRRVWLLHWPVDAALGSSGPKEG